MKTARLTILWTICLSVSLGAAAIPQTNKGAAMTTHATGTFTVKATPQPPDENAGGAAIGRMLLDKQFHGDLEATSKGTMLAAGTAVQGSAGYVAIELVTGTLHDH